MTTKDRKKLAALITKLENCKKVISNERDKMVNLFSEYEDIIGSCDNAEDDITICIDRLSEYL